MKIFVDKILSVTKNVPLTRQVLLTDAIPAKDGTLLAVEVMENKKVYNKVELRTGRFSIIKKGDTLVVALGQRRALMGFVGDIPTKVTKGDVIHLLNMGGVAGICTSSSAHEVGKPLRLKVLGALCDASKKVLSIKDSTLFKPEKKLRITIPLIAVSGTSMNVGKTSVASEIIRQATKKGYRFAAAKLAGIAALKDTEAMEDYGACGVTSFLDAGYSSTIGLNGNAAPLSYGALNYLAETTHPDAIVVELGDGLLGDYGVMSILKDSGFRKAVTVHIGCAHDPVGAVKLSEICKKLKVPLSLISGPITDNSVGVGFVTKTIKIPAINALYNGVELFETIEPLCFKK